jgi:hypothetical protein
VRPIAWFLLPGALGSVLSCKPERAGPREPVADAPASAKPAPRPPPTAIGAGEQREIPTGAFRAGSTPGEPGRHPDVEPRSMKVELGAYRIDRLPFPNDPKQKSRTGVTRDEASRICGERGARLCTELEWERACKGPESDRFPSGTAWEPRCAREPSSCASGFDVLGMGMALREWTASDVAAGTPKARAALRGAGPEAPAQEHRCAARTGVAASAREDDIGFRCCEGPPNARELSEPVLGRAYRKVKMGADRLSALLAGDPITRGLAKDVKYFREPDAVETVLARGPGD